MSTGLMLIILCVTVLPDKALASSATQATTQGEETEITKAPAAAASNLVAELHVPRQRRPNPQYIGPEWIVWVPGASGGNSYV